MVLVEERYSKDCIGIHAIALVTAIGSPGGAPLDFVCNVDGRGRNRGQDLPALGYGCADVSFVPDRHTPPHCSSKLRTFFRHEPD
jgi:hypothetical protein